MVATHAWQRLNSYDEDYGLDGRGDDDNDSCDYDDDDGADSDGDDDASCATHRGGRYSFFGIERIFL